jgi:hypothetical protein
MRGGCARRVALRATVPGVISWREVARNGFQWDHWLSLVRLEAVGDMPTVFRFASRVECRHRLLAAVGFSPAATVPTVLVLDSSCRGPGAGGLERST